MKGPRTTRLFTGIEPDLDEDDWRRIRAAVDDLPEMEVAAYLGTDEVVKLAALDVEAKALYVIGTERGGETVAIERWPIGDSSVIRTFVQPKRSGTYGLVRERSWHFDFGDGREIQFDSLEQNADEFENRLSMNEVFARELCRLLGWEIPG